MNRQLEKRRHLLPPQTVPCTHASLPQAPYGTPRSSPSHFICRHPTGSRAITPTGIALALQQAPAPARRGTVPPLLRPANRPAGTRYPHPIQQPHSNDVPPHPTSGARYLPTTGPAGQQPDPLRHPASWPQRASRHIRQRSGNVKKKHTPVGISGNNAFTACSKPRRRRLPSRRSLCSRRPSLWRRSYHGVRAGCSGVTWRPGSVWSGRRPWASAAPGVVFPRWIVAA